MAGIGVELALWTVFLGARHSCGGQNSQLPRPISFLRAPSCEKSRSSCCLSNVLLSTMYPAICLIDMAKWPLPFEWLQKCVCSQASLPPRPYINCIEEPGQEARRASDGTTPAAQWLFPFPTTPRRPHLSKAGRRFNSASFWYRLATTPVWVACADAWGLIHALLMA